MSDEIFSRSDDECNGTVILMHVTCTYPVHPGDAIEVIEAQSVSTKKALEDMTLRLKSKIAKDLSDHLCLRPDEIGISCAIMGAQIEKVPRSSSGAHRDQRNFAVATEAPSGMGHLQRLLAGDDNFAASALDASIKSARTVEDVSLGFSRSNDHLTPLQFISNYLIQSYVENAARHDVEGVHFSEELFDKFEMLLVSLMFFGLEILNLDDLDNLTEALNAVHGPEGIGQIICDHFSVDVAQCLEDHDTYTLDDFRDMSDEELMEVFGDQVRENNKKRVDALSELAQITGIQGGVLDWLSDLATNNDQDEETP